MHRLVKIFFVVLLPQVFLAILIYHFQNLPNYDNLPELKAQFAESRISMVDHSSFPELQKDFKNAHQITAACLSCHINRGDELLKSPHFNWEREMFIEGRGVVYSGKKNGLNNFCTGIAGSEATCNRCHAGYGYSDKNYDFSNPYNIDCMVCHDNSRIYKKASGGAGYPDPNLTKEDYRKIFAHLGTPTKHNCGECHFHSAGGNNIKHGQLETALLDCTKEVDVHMSKDGGNLECIDCHVTENHIMKGRYYGISSENYNRASCEDCHTKFPHKQDLINEHTLKVSCQVCHIPIYAKVNATKMYWDWSTACNLKDGNPYFETDKDGNETFLSEKGNFVWQKNVVPEYVWFNGTANHHYLTDDIKSIPVQINSLNGEYKDHNSKIWPVKVHRGKQPYDTEYNRIVQPKLWDAEKGRGGLWVDYNWDSALVKGMEYLNLPYSGKHGFVETEMYLPLNHMVSPSENALGCSDCHTRTNSRLAGLTDFYMPGRDRNIYLDWLGLSIVLMTLLGIMGHAAMRYMASRKNTSNH